MLVYAGGKSARTITVFSETQNYEDIPHPTWLYNVWFFNKRQVLFSARKN